MESKKWDIAQKEDGEGTLEDHSWATRDRKQKVQSSACQKAPQAIYSRKWNYRLPNVFEHMEKRFIQLKMILGLYSDKYIENQAKQKARLYWLQKNKMCSVKTVIMVSISSIFMVIIYRLTVVLIIRRMEGWTSYLRWRSRECDRVLNLYLPLYKVNR